MRHAVIMAGGAGTRMWPASRMNRPKQLLRLFGGKSLLRESYERVADAVGAGSVYVITGAGHLPLVARDVPEIPTGNLLGEPCGRDTANAVGLSAAVLRQRDPDATMGVFTADHIITPVERFRQALRRGYEAAEGHPDALVTFGIKPTHPHTGFGYVQRGDAVEEGVFAVRRFAEKPDQETANRYVADGGYYWNSGMFVWRVDTILEQLRQHLPASYDSLMELAGAWDSPERDDALSRVYPALEKISIDYAVMERAPRVLVVELDCHWVDVGSWTSLEHVLRPDENGNVTAGGRSVHMTSGGTVTVSEEDHLIATLGVRDLVIVHTADATLVAHKDQAQQLKDLVACLRGRFGDQYL